jgi:hypothetical protein
LDDFWQKIAKNRHFLTAQLILFVFFLIDTANTTAVIASRWVLILSQCSLVGTNLRHALIQRMGTFFYNYFLLKTNKILTKEKFTEKKD